ncbi:MAG: MMPL family transporter, partial [Acidimicrobiia bacterium]
AGTSLSPLTVALGSLTAAVGAEFTVFARERVAAGADRPWAGVVAAAATSVAGFGALAVSQLSVLREFGLVLAGTVLLSLLAARLLTPSARSAVAPRGVPQP